MDKLSICLLKKYNLDLDDEQLKNYHQMKIYEEGIKLIEFSEDGDLKLKEDLEMALMKLTEKYKL